MCGIAGYIGFNSISEKLVEKTSKLMNNRGPDHQNYIRLKNKKININLLASRLSIIDLEHRSNQPFVLDKYVLVFNGEIYNYVELREKLEQKGVRFKTKSDTEVLLQSYINYGDKCIEHFEGMWSFAIYDPYKERLFLSRDRFAEKPLYYIRCSNGIYFGSEIKFLASLLNEKLEVNINQIVRYLVYGYKALYKKDETFFKDVHELAFASNMLIDYDLNVNITPYWTPKYNPQSMSLDEAVAGVRERLIESMRLRLRADVPLAFCLSGGVDSSALASIAAKIFNADVSTFSIIDKDVRYNENENIQTTVKDLRCKNTIIELDGQNTYHNISNLIKYHDSPVATITYYIHSLLSKTISEKGYKVVFSGTGADELFTGYYDHFIQYLYETKDSINHNKYFNEWKTYILPDIRNPIYQDGNLFIKNPDFRGHIFDNHEEFESALKVNYREEFSERKFTGSLLRNRMMNEIFFEVTRVILHEDDMNSMMYSIENRSPYLDRNLFEYVYTIPSEYLIRNGYGKYILRMAMSGILNDKVRLDRKKRGFNASIKTLFDFNKESTRKLILDDSRIFEIIDKKYIEKIIDQNSHINSYSKFIFNFINSKIFLELFT